MGFLSQETMERRKEQIYADAEQAIEDMYIREVKKVLTWFRDKFPKRHLQWMDGMGTHMWILDGEIWNCHPFEHAPIYRDGGYWGDSEYLTEREWTKKELLLKPLVDFYSSMVNETWSNRAGNQIGVWEIDRVSREIVEVVEC